MIQETFPSLFGILLGDEAEMPEDVLFEELEKGYNDVKLFDKLYAAVMKELNKEYGSSRAVMVLATNLYLLV